MNFEYLYLVFGKETGIIRKARIQFTIHNPLGKNYQMVCSSNQEK